MIYNITLLHLYIIYYTIFYFDHYNKYILAITPKFQCIGDK